MDKSQKFLIGLGVSLALNLLLLAVIAFRAPTVPEAKAVLYSIGRGQLESILQVIPQPRRGQLRAAMQADINQLNELSGKGNAARALLIDQMDKTQINPAELGKVLGEIRAAQSASDALAERMTGNLLMTLSMEERMLISDIMRHGQQTR